MAKIRRMGDEGRVAMTVMIDPKLHRWLSRGDNRSDSAERAIRQVFEESERQDRIRAKQQRSLTETTYTWSPERRAAEKAKSMAGELGRVLRDHNIKSDRSRMLRYELLKFISEVAHREH
jgi:hypothetical protein